MRNRLSFCVTSALVAAPRSPCFVRCTAMMSCASSNDSDGRITPAAPVGRVEEVFRRLASSPAGVFLLDGGTGEELFRQGVPDDRDIWSATAVVHPEYHGALERVHRSFVDAGSQAVTTNSYGIVPGVGFAVEEISKHCADAGRIARDAVRGTEAMTFGSMGPLVESYRPDKILPHDEGVAFYRTMAQSLAPYVDAFLAETMSSVEESLQAVQAVSSLAGENEALPMLVSYTLDSSGNIRSGESVVAAIPRVLDFAHARGVNVMSVLFNCAEPEAITQALERIVANSKLKERLKSESVVLGAYANRLPPVASDWTLADSDEPAQMRKDLDPER